MREHQGFLLFEYQGGHIVGVEEVAGYSLKIFGSDGVDATEEGVEVALVPMMQIASAKVEGKLLPIVTGNSKLAFQLALGFGELLLTEGLLHQAI